MEFRCAECKAEAKVMCHVCTVAPFIKERDDALLQIKELRAALFCEVKGVACGPECEGGGYRQCIGCDDRVKLALGLKPGQSIHDADPRNDKTNDSHIDPRTGKCTRARCNCT